MVVSQFQGRCEFCYLAAREHIVPMTRAALNGQIILGPQICTL